MDEIVKDSTESDKVAVKGEYDDLILEEDR